MEKCSISRIKFSGQIAILNLTLKEMKLIGMEMNERILNSSYHIIIYKHSSILATI